MFLRVAAIYERNDKNKFEVVSSASHDKKELQDCLAIFENETLPAIEPDFADGEIFVDSSPDAGKRKAEYYYYVQYHSACEKNKEHICLMVTDRKMYQKVKRRGEIQDGSEVQQDQWEDIGERQFRMLLLNIHHVHVRGAALKVTLDQIVRQSLNYIGKEIHIQALQNQLTETKRVLIEEVIPKVTERGNMIEDLEEKSIKLSEAATLFNKNATELNKTKCCGIEAPSIPYVPFINPNPNPLK